MTAHTCPKCGYIFAAKEAQAKETEREKAYKEWAAMVEKALGKGPDAETDRALRELFGDEDDQADDDQD